jgi:glycosyltransferase involved in cell wall biosynthesis
MKFTIVTPSYNKGPYLDRTIQSVLMQQGGLVELDYLILDNCSTDQTIEVLQQYEHHPKRMQSTMACCKGVVKLSLG